MQVSAIPSRTRGFHVMNGKDEMEEPLGMTWLKIKGSQVTIQDTIATFSIIPVLLVISAAPSIDFYGQIVAPRVRTSLMDLNRAMQPIV